MPHLRIIATENLKIDPDVQLEFAEEPKRIAKLMDEWDPNKAGVLTVVPNGDDGHYYIVGGRHRFKAGVPKGMREWRCDVHDEVKTIADKVALKLSEDRDRRRVRPLEHFLVRLKAEQLDAVEINEIVEHHGYTIGNPSKTTPTVISAVTALELIYRFLGADGLSRTMALNTVWMGEAQTNTGHWIKALGILVRDGYGENITPVGYERLRGIVPAKQVKLARGEMEVHMTTGGASGWGSMPAAIATRVRKSARLTTRRKGSS